MLLLSPGERGRRGEEWERREGIAQPRHHLVSVRTFGQLSICPSVCQEGSPVPGSGCAALPACIPVPGVGGTPLPAPTGHGC